MHRWSSNLRPPSTPTRPTPWRHAPGTAPTPGQLRGPSWRRSSRGLYVPVDVPATVEQRIVEAAALLPGYGAVGGWAAAYWQGVRLLDGWGSAGTTRQPVLLCLGAGRKIRRRPGVVVSRARLPEHDLCTVSWLACTRALRTAFDGARMADDLTEAVVFIDMLLSCGLVELADVRAYVASHAGWAGVDQCRRALDLAVLGSRSPPESRLRLIWVMDAQLPQPLVNAPVFDPDGRLLGYPDLLDPEAGCVLEYDGDDHRDMRNHSQDNDREERLEEHGLVVMRVTRLHLRGARDHLVARMRRTRLRGLGRDRSHDRWTLRPPPWWR